MTAEKIKKRMRLYEIEHDGDVQNAVDELRRCGAENIQVEDTNFDDEDMVVSFEATQEALTKIRTEADICL